MLALYSGAFLGPFAGNVVAVLLPTLQAWYGVDVQAAALAVTAYVAPFAAAQFVSGAVADRFGRRPVLVAGFAGFGLTALLAALAPTFPVFLAARAGQGLSNALTTPVLMAELGDLVESRRLGRALGLFGAANTAGLFLAPLVAGLCATADWRLVYLLMAIASALLAVLQARRRVLPAGLAGSTPPTTTPTPSHHATVAGTVAGTTGSTITDAVGMPAGTPTTPSPSSPPSPPNLWRQIQLAMTPRLALLCAAAMLGYLSLNGVGFLIALSLATTHGLGPAESGLLLSAFGLANMLSAGPAGAVVDRLGSIPVSAAGTLTAAAVLAALPLLPTGAGTAAVAALLLLGGAAVACLWSGLTKLAVEASPSRRATATSVFNAWKFVGYSLAPVVYGPLYAASGATAAFGAAACATLLILPCLAALRTASTEPATPATLTEDATPLPAPPPPAAAG